MDMAGAIDLFAKESTRRDKASGPSAVSSDITISNSSDRSSRAFTKPLASDQTSESTSRMVSQ